MTTPINTPWALNDLTGIECVVPGRGTTLYDNKSAPPLEIQLYGILHNTPLALQEINYQFDMLYKFNEWVKRRQPNILIEATTARTLSETDIGNYVRFSSGSAVTYTINGGVAQVGDTVVLRQAGAGVVTVSPGTGTVTLKRKSGFAAKTGGVDTTITLVKVLEPSSGVETWDLFGDLGV